MMNPEIEQSEVRPISVATPRTVWGREDSLRHFFFGRLGYLVQLRDGTASGLKAQDDWLIKRALYSTYRDCASIGLGDEALALLKA
jgi:hypothetical protein